MTISSTTVKTITGLGNGISTNHVIGFPFQLNAQIEVYLIDESAVPATSTLLVFGAGAGKYTFTGGAGDPNTTIVMGTALSTTQRAIIQRAVPRQQNVDYVTTQFFPAEDHEEQMDRQTMMDQEDADKLSRALTLWPTVVGFNPVLPSDIATPDQVILTNATGTGFRVATLAGGVGAAGPAGANGTNGLNGADGLNAPTMLLQIPSSGVRDGVNQNFVLANVPFVGANVIAVVDGVLSESLVPVGSTVTVSAPLAALLANVAIDLKFLYIRT